MKKSSQLGMILGIAAMFSGDQYAHVSDDYRPKRNPQPKEVTPPIPKGHKKFIIEGREIWALNHKNALKKFKKLK